MDGHDFEQSLSDPLPGTLLAGRYQIIRRVGTGGMGTVYRAVQTGLERPVGLKVLRRELSWDKATVMRFHREAKAMSLLTHPNTVRVFDFGQTDEGLLFFAMELLEGELLTARIEREGAIDVREAIRIARQVLGSLSEAHGAGIIHRDLKPDNVILAKMQGEQRPVVKVLDFGIAKVVLEERKLDQLETQAGTVFGTPRYMSPEQAQGGALDARSDLYSVGVLLYHMLAGHPPFVDDDAVVVMARHIKDVPQSLRAAAPDRAIPADLERLVMRALEKDPRDRFATGELFDAALEQCLKTIVSSREETERLVPVRSKRSGRWLIGTAALAVAVALPWATYVAMGRGGAEAVAPPSLVEAPSRSPAVAQTETRLELDSVPSGAHVWSEGVELGTTPLTIARPARTDLLLELRLDGYDPVHVFAVVGEPLAPVPLVRQVSQAEQPPSSISPALPAARQEVETPRISRAVPRRDSPRLTRPRASPEPRRPPGEPYEVFD